MVVDHDELVSSPTIMLEHISDWFRVQRIAIDASKWHTGGGARFEYGRADPDLVAECTKLYELVVKASDMTCTPETPPILS